MRQEMIRERIPIPQEQNSLRSRAVLSRLQKPGIIGGHAGAGSGNSRLMNRTMKSRQRLRQALVSVICLLSTGLAAREVEDATGRRVAVPDRVERVMAAGPTAAVVLYVLAPEKMIGWPSAPRPHEREFILPAVRDLPELGRLTGRGDTANVEVVLKARP